MSDRRSGELETYPKGRYSRLDHWFCNKDERTSQGKWEAQRTRCTESPPSFFLPLAGTTLNATL